MKPGETTEDVRKVGRKLTWDEACACIGQTILQKHVLQSMTYYEAVVPEKYLPKAMPFYIGEKRVMSDRLICYAGTRQRALIDEFFCRHPWKDEDGSFYEVSPGQD